ncbi:MAG: CsgG/HfaB family protein [Janthinobacterium lividum]
MQGRSLRRTGRIVLLALALQSAPAAAQDVVLVPVRSYGYGPSEAAAVKDAIVQAVGQVSGERLAAATTVTTSSLEQSGRPAQHSAAIAQRIDSLIRGVVKSSNTVSVEREGDGSYRATVDVRVASLRRSAQLERVRLAVVAGAQQAPAALGEAAPEFMRALLDGLSDRLVASRKFAVLDRQEQAAVEREFAHIRSGRTGVEDYVRLQSAAAADFLVVVSVSHLSASDKLLGGARARATVRAQLLDYGSGQVRQAVSANGVKTLRPGALQAFGAELGARLAHQFVDSVFPARVIGVDGESLTVSAGESQFQRGDAVRVLRRGAALKDPDTGESLGYAEVPVGTGKVEETGARVSVVRLAGAQLEPGSLRKQTYIVRKEAAAPSALAAQIKQIQQQGETNDDDW